MSALDWQDDAACRTENPELFFPDTRALAAIAEAKAVCGRCPVRAECLDMALGLSPSRDQAGILAGLTPEERAKVRTRRNGLNRHQLGQLGKTNPDEGDIQ